MTKQQPDFKKPSNNQASWYDLREDWGLVEASLATQYNIRIRQHTDMPWTEFCTLVSGLMPETPLGNVVTIRSEKDTKVIKGFTPEQRRIYTSWKLRGTKQQLGNPEELKKSSESLEKVMANLFGSKEVKT